MNRDGRLPSTSMKGIMEKYGELDRQILEAVKVGRILFGPLSINPKVKAEADRIAMDEKPNRWGDKQPGWRIIDRRLQALRKSGKIYYGRGNNSGWDITV